MLNVEHRSAQAPEPVELKLVADSDGGAYLEITGSGSHSAASDADVFAAPTLSHRVLEMLGTARVPLRRSELRERLAVNNQRLGEALAHLENAGQLDRSADGWALRSSVPF